MQPLRPVVKPRSPEISTTASYKLLQWQVPALADAAHRLVLLWASRDDLSLTRGFRQQGRSCWMRSSHAGYGSARTHRRWQAAFPRRSGVARQPLPTFSCPAEPRISLSIPIITGAGAAMTRNT